MEKKSLSIDFILKKIWNYAEDADTHTVETHIYRLRKKIAKKFNDSDFILNSSKGYSL
jgi:DNA-binding response OmpR family regulator